ncbi:MAG: hypothetical protein ABL977_09250, partial [Candidatus Eisenbacteria bacterium]
MAAVALVLSGTGPLRAATREPDRYTRLIARADAVALGRVLDAGVREVRVPGERDLASQYVGARVAIDRWLVGPDTAGTIEVQLGGSGWHAQQLQASAQDPQSRVILYLRYYDRNGVDEWCFVGDPVWPDGKRGRAGYEILPLEVASKRVPVILAEARRTSPESLAVRAELAVIGSLEFPEDGPGMTCHIDRILFGRPPDSVLNVVSEHSGDFRRGRALLLLRARRDSTWELLEGG